MSEAPSGLLPLPAWQQTGVGCLAIGAVLRVRARAPVDDPEQELTVALELLASIPLRWVEATAVADLRLGWTAVTAAVPGLDEDEAYRLSITEDGIDLEAGSRVGVVRGLATLAQLATCVDGLWSWPVGQIEDRPRFPWRGLLLDVSRHFLPMDLLARTLLAMAAVKFNVLHLHLSDDQGFRVESRRFPRLHEMGSDGSFYRQAELVQLIQRAAALGIRVVPEFGVPGHASSWLVGYPELGTRQDHGYQLADRWGPQDACLDPLNEAVYRFLEEFFAEMAELFPDVCVHIGGDEVSGVEWQQDPRAMAFLASRAGAGPGELQAHFNARLGLILGRLGRRMIGWDEVAHPDLPEAVMVQSWRGAESLAECAERGQSCIRSHGYYLDLLQPASAHAAIDPLAATAGLTTAARQRILGGEACLWGEQVDAANMETRLWPRAAAIAECLWSSADAGQRQLYPRLRRVSAQLAGLGCAHHSAYLSRLEQLAGRLAVADLRQLTDLLAPLPRSSDRRTRLDRLADALPVESDTAQEFAELVAEFADTAAPAQRLQLEQRLDRWAVVAATFDATFAGHDLHAELAPHAAALGPLLQVARTALEFHDSDTVPPCDWLASAIGPQLDAIQGHAGMALQLVEPVRRLAELVVAR